MEVRKFEALSMQDAIKLVKRELGKDAVILSTREKATRVEGSSEPLRIIEVVAARASSSSTHSPDSLAHSRSSRGLSAQVLTPEQAAKATRVDFPRVQKQSDTTIVKGSPTLTSLNQDTRRAAQTLASALGPRERLVENNTARANNANVENASAEVKDLREEIARVRKEIESLPHVNMNDQMQEIKVLLHDLMRTKQKSDLTGLHQYLNDIGIKMRAAGVQESLISQIMETVSGVTQPTSPDGTALSTDRLKEFYLNQALRCIFKNFDVTGPWKSEGRQRIISLVGPTGVGKTTTIAKLAARMKLTENQKVALVSMDSFRIAAADQLRVYAKILDCPFAELSDMRELEAFVQKHFDYDTIFVDTAGRSTRQEGQMDGLRSLQTTSLPIHFHLVLSSTMKQRDIDETIKAFRFLSPESLLFTKLDESWSFGEILSSTMQSKIPLSYFTTGQKVPEDIETASKERVVERIFRL